MADRLGELHIMELPTSLVQELVPITEFDLSDKAQLSVDRLAVKGLEVVSGIRVADLEDILVIAETDGVVEYCPKDRVSRFKDEESAQKWVSKGRGGFLLRTMGDHEIVGYSWIGPEPCEELPDHPITTAFRTTVRGTGLDLTVATVEGGKAQFDIDGYGLETWASNGGAVKTYVRAGAEFVTSKSFEKNKTTGSMERVARPTLQDGDHVFERNGKKVVADTRIFMAFPYDQAK